MKIPDPVHSVMINAKPPQGGTVKEQFTNAPVYADIKGDIAPPQGKSPKSLGNQAVPLNTIKAKPPHGKSVKEQMFKPVRYYTNEAPPTEIKKETVPPPVHPDIPNVKPPQGEQISSASSAPKTSSSEEMHSPAEKKEKQFSERPSAYDLAEYLRERYVFKAFADQERLGVYDVEKGCFLFQKASKFPKFALQAFEETPYKSLLTRSLLREIFHFLVFEPALQALPSEFNRNEMLINVKNGVFDLTDRRLHPHSPEFMFTSTLDVDYIPTNKIPRRFMEMMHSMFNGQKSDIDRCLESLAYLLSNNTSAKKMVFFLGVHDSGKSTLARLLAHIVGMGFVSALPIERFGGKFELGSLISCRLNICPEVEKMSANVVRVIKAVTGGDLQPLENKFEEMFYEMLNIKFLLAGNILPAIPPRLKIDDGFLSRLLLVYFPNSVPTGKRLEKYDRTLFELEGQEILSLLLKYLCQWESNRHEFTNSATSDRIFDELQGYGTITERSFAEQAFIKDENAFLSNDALYSQYASFCINQNSSPCSLGKLKEILLRFYPTSKKARKRLNSDGNPVAGIQGLRFK